MTTRIGWIAVAAFAVATSACASMSVSSHVERGTDFTRYRTWDWGPADALPTGDPRLDSNPFFTDRFEGAVEKGLAGHGLTRAAAGAHADLLVHYHANISQRFQVNEPSSECNGGPGCDVRVVEYDQGTLVLDVIDPRLDKLIWRGWAQDSVQGTLDNQRRLERQIDEAVSKMLARFPVR